MMLRNALILALMLTFYNCKENTKEPVTSETAEDIINKSITKEWVTSISDDIQNTVWDYITDKNDKLATIILIKFNNYI